MRNITKRPTGIAAVMVVAALIAALGVGCSGGDDTSEPTQQVLVVEPTASPARSVAASAPIRTASSTPTPEPTPEPTPSPEPKLVSLDWLAADVALPPFEPIAAQHTDAGLDAAITAALADFHGESSVVVRDLKNGISASINASRTWYAASTFKAAILLTAYQQRDAGTLDFESIVTLKPEYAEDDLGTLDYLGIRPNDTITVGDAIKGMIVVSDTPLAVMLEDVVGGNAVDAALRNIGATTMSVNSHDLPTTAADLAALLVAIDSGQEVSSESRAEMLSLMSQEWYRSGIAAGLPDGTQYAHKSGTLGAATHDAAIVWGPNGPYVIVVMTDGSGGWDPIAAVSSAVWAYFNGATAGN
ncbi:MAG: serine hydrolase [Chloroflexota bacterium]